jgi:ribose transport system substrate-binding protein
LIGMGRGLSETAEKVVPSSITLFSAVVTKENVAQYADVGF